MATTVYECSTL